MTDTDQETEGTLLRTFTGTPDLVLSIICFTIAVAHLYVAFDPVLSELQRNAFHFAGFAALATEMQAGV